MGENPSSIGDAYGLGARAIGRASRRQKLWLILGVLAVVALPFLMAGLSTLP